MCQSQDDDADDGKRSRSRSRETDDWIFFHQLSTALFKSIWKETK